MWREMIYRWPEAKLLEENGEVQSFNIAVRNHNKRGFTAR